MNSSLDPEALAAEALDRVDVELLTGTGSGGFLRTGYFADGALVDRLDPGEQPHFSFSHKKQGVEIDWSTSTEQVAPSRSYRTGLLVTDRRILCLVGKKTGDRRIALPYDLVSSVERVSGFLTDKLVVDVDDATYSFYVKKTENLGAAVSYISQVTAESDGSNESARERGSASSENGATERDSTRSVSEDEPQQDTSTAENAASGQRAASASASNSAATDSDTSGDAELVADGSSQLATETETEPPLPTPDRVGELDETAGQFVESAATRLTTFAGDVDREDRIRAHADLCIALDALDDTSDSVVADLERALAVLETELSETSRDETIEEATTESMNTTLELFVRDEDDQPVRGATAVLEGRSVDVSAQTSSDGSCSVNVPQGTESLELSVTHPGYESVSTTTTVVPDDVYDVQLVPEDSGDDAAREDGGDDAAREDGGDDAAREDGGDGPDRQQLLAELQRLNDEWSLDIDRKLLHSVGEYHPEAYVSEFGSLEQARVEAGVTDDGTDETAGDDEADDTTGSTDTGETNDELEQAIRDAGLGTKDSAESRAGDETTNATSSSTHEGYSREEVIAEIRRLTRQLGRPPKTSEMQNYGEMSPTPAYRYWSGWQEALDAAGVTEESSTSTTDAETNAAANSVDDGEATDTAADSGDEGEARDSGDDGKATDSGDDEEATDAAGLPPNELAELYDRFGLYQSVLEDAVEVLDGSTASFTRQWYEAVYDYWGGDGVESASCLGYQQNHRNDLSIHEYRTQYGNGSRVTDFQYHEVRSIDDRPKRYLEGKGLSLTEGKSRVPVAPESNTALPIVVQTEAELENALDLLAEFPARPAADATGPSGTARDEDLTEGRLDSIVVEVLEADSNPGSRRDARLQVETEAGVQMPMDVWSKHDVDVAWERNQRYELRDPRQKVWEKGSAVERSLSSTRDLEVHAIGTETATGSSKGSGEQRAQETGDDGDDDGGVPDEGDDDGDADDEADDIVDTIMGDIDLGGSP